MGAIHSIVRNNLKELFSNIKGKGKASLAILGLDGSGKSTLVNLFKDVDVPTFPTLGFNMEEITFNNTTIKIWDIGGQREFITYWKQYVDGVNGLVFMIDIADSPRFKDSYEGFKTLVPYLRDRIPILIFLNKCDIFNSNEEINKNAAEIERLYHIEDSYMKADDKVFKVKVSKISVKNDRDEMNIDETKTIKTASVYDGFNWLVDEIKRSEIKR